MVRTKPRLYEYQERRVLNGGPYERSIEDLGRDWVKDTRDNTSCVSLVEAPEYRKQLAEMPCRCFKL